MPFTTPEQFVLLFVVLVAGWLIGYASAPGTRKYKRELRDQAALHTRYHDDAEEQLREANARNAALTRETEVLRDELADADRTIAALRSSAPLPPHNGI